MLVCVAVDRSARGGKWNGPVDMASGEFAYVPIPEGLSTHAGFEKPYIALAPALARFGVELPAHLRECNMHLDPDFEHLTYGDVRQRAVQLQTHLSPDDRIVFYAGLRDTSGARRLVYAIIGLFVVDRFECAALVTPEDRDINAHSRRVLAPDANDKIVRARPAESGRLKRCLPIGEYRDRAYRVRTDLLHEWGGLSVKNGYLQRSARLPRFLDPDRFQRWLETQDRSLVQANN